MIGEAPVERYQVSLPPEIAEGLRSLGKGNLSAGIRTAYEKSGHVAKVATPSATPTITSMEPVELPPIKITPKPAYLLERIEALRNLLVHQDTPELHRALRHCMKTAKELGVPVPRKKR